MPASPFVESSIRWVVHPVRLISGEHQERERERTTVIWEAQRRRNQQESN